MHCDAATGRRRSPAAQHMTGSPAHPSESSTLRRRSPERTSHANWLPELGPGCCVAGAASTMASFIWHRPVGSYRTSNRSPAQLQSSAMDAPYAAATPDEMDRTTYQTGILERQYISCRCNLVLGRLLHWNLIDRTSCRRNAL